MGTNREISESGLAPSKHITNGIAEVSVKDLLCDAGLSYEKAKSRKFELYTPATDDVETN